MTLNLFFHALWTLSALGTVVCAAEVRRPRDAWIFGLVFLAALGWFGPQRPPDPSWVGFIAAAAAAHRLAWPDRTALMSAVGGLLAAVCATLIAFEGLHVAAAALAVAGVAGVSGYLSTTKAAFAPARLREEAALALMLIGLGVAMAPGVVTGWGAAQALNLPDRNISAPMVPSWVIAIGSGAILLGGAHRLWRR